MLREEMKDGTLLHEAILLVHGFVAALISETSARPNISTKQNSAHNSFMCSNFCISILACFLSYLFYYED